jgi:hypothetical protein
MTCPKTGSTMRKKPRVESSIVQVGSTATARAKGNAAAIAALILGTKRNTAAKIPHKIALGAN